MGEADRGQHLVLALGVEVEQARPRAVRRRRPSAAVGPEPLDHRGRVVPGGGQVGRPLPAPLGQVDPLEEGRDDLAQLGQHQLGVVRGPRAAGGRASAAGAARRTGRCRRCRRWRARRPAAGPAAASRALARTAWRWTKSESPGLAGVAGDEPGLQPGQQLGVGVEHPVHVAHVAGAERRVEDLGRPVVAVVAARQPGVVADVAGRLLEVGHQAAPLEDLGQHVGGLLAGQVDAAQLGHRVVAVLEEDPLVELSARRSPTVASIVASPRDVEVARRTRRGRAGAGSWASASSGRRGRPSPPRAG